MTPEQYLERIRELLAAGRDEAILDLAQQFGPEVHPKPSDAELDLLRGTLKGAVMSVKLSQAALVQEGSLSA